MAQSVDPDEWERDIKKIDNRLAERRVIERRRRDRWGRYIERAALLALVVLYIVGFVSADHQRDDLKRQQKVLTQQQGALERSSVSQKQLLASQLSTCRRVNILRAQSNISDYVSFTILSLSARREAALEGKDVPQTRGIHRRASRLLAEQAALLAVTGPTDCMKAVRAPSSYRVPLAGPIGDPLTGKVPPHVRSVLRHSRAFLRENTRR